MCTCTCMYLYYTLYHSLSGRKCFSNILRSLEFELLQSLWNLTGTSAAPYPKRFRDSGKGTVHRPAEILPTVPFVHISKGPSASENNSYVTEWRRSPVKSSSIKCPGYFTGLEQFWLKLFLQVGHLMHLSRVQIAEMMMMIMMMMMISLGDSSHIVQCL